jgi:hypothetical protein
MASKYLIQVVSKKTGKVVEWAPGLAVERQFEDEICNRVAAKGVGIARTTAHVVADVRAAVEELLHDLKSDVRP